MAEVSRPIVTLYGDALFNSGKTTIKDDATDELDRTINEMESIIGTDTDFKIIVVGYTDSDRIIQDSNLCRKDNICTNDQLGLARANSVVKYIEKKWSDMPETAEIKEDSAGDKCATKINPSKNQKALDRKVQFWVFFGNEKTKISDFCVEPDDDK